MNDHAARCGTGIIFDDKFTCSIFSKKNKKTQNNDTNKLFPLLNQGRIKYSLIIYYSLEINDKMGHSKPLVFQ